MAQKTPIKPSSPRTAKRSGDTATAKSASTTNATRTPSRLEAELQATLPQAFHPTLGMIARSWGKLLVGYIVVVMLVNGLFVASFNVPTSSMENTVMTGDFVWVNKFIFGASTPQVMPFSGKKLPFYKFPAWRSPERGDVIVFIYPGDRDEAQPREFMYYLKRCVAIGGDMIEIRDKQLYVNGTAQPLAPESKLRTDGALPLPPNDDINTFPMGAGFTRDNYGPLRVPRKGESVSLTAANIQQWDTFIRREGHDVTQFDGAILIDGKPAASYTVERDYCFGMGDNRDNSVDSRYWGFVPLESVVGTPIMVYWSWDTNYVGESFWATLQQKFRTLRSDRIGTIIR
jgi:signal peptidase I